MASTRKRYGVLRKDYNGCWYIIAKKDITAFEEALEAPRSSDLTSEEKRSAVDAFADQYGPSRVQSNALDGLEVVLPKKSS